MNAEERLRAALADRAERARTSPDALDAVFGRVARHRRTVRLTAALSVAGVAVAGAAVASGMSPGTNAVRPVTPAPATSTPATDEPTPSATPSASPSATPTPEAEFVPVRVTFPDDTALVVLADRRLVAISTTTGVERVTLGTLPPAVRDGKAATLDWSPDRRHVVYETGDCRLHRLDVANGTSTPLGRGRTPQIAADGRVAAVDCATGGDIVVIDPVTRRSTTYAARDEDATTDQGYPDPWETSAYVASVAWSGTHLVIARIYEGAVDVRIVDVTTGKAFGSDAADHVAIRGMAVATLHCCYPGEHGKDTTTFFTVPDILDRRRPTPREEIFTHPGNIHSLTLDARGAIVYGGAEGGLWRWSGGEPRLIRNGVEAVSG